MKVLCSQCRLYYDQRDIALVRLEGAWCVKCRANATTPTPAQSATPAASTATQGMPGGLSIWDAARKGR